MNYQDIKNLIGGESDHFLLDYKSKTLSKTLLHIPSPDFVDKVFALSLRTMADSLL